MTWPICVGTLQWMPPSACDTCGFIERSWILGATCARVGKGGQGRSTAGNGWARAGKGGHGWARVGKGGQMMSKAGTWRCWMPMSKQIIPPNPAPGSACPALAWWGQWGGGLLGYGGGWGGGLALATTTHTLTVLLLTVDSPSRRLYVYPTTKHAYYTASTTLLLALTEEMVAAKSCSLCLEKTAPTVCVGLEEEGVERGCGEGVWRGDVERGYGEGVWRGDVERGCKEVCRESANRG